MILLKQIRKVLTLENFKQNVFFRFFIRSETFHIRIKLQKKYLLTIFIFNHVDIKMCFCNKNQKPFFKTYFFRYFTFWNNYNIIMDLLFMIGLLIRTVEYIIDDSTMDISAVRKSIIHLVSPIQENSIIKYFTKHPWYNIIHH